MVMYDGFVSTDNGEVHVILGLDDDRVTMSSNGNEIGAWSADEVDVDHVGDGVYRITAEEESLRFVPNNPSLFGLVFEGAETEETADTGISPEQQRAPEPAPGSTANPVTMSMFYALAAVTAALGIWAAISLLIG